jgi:hypothetical protein
VKRSQIFAHRGFWKEGGFTPNSIESLESAFEKGFAVETDVRDQQEEIVISPELHGREFLLAWEEFSKLAQEVENIGICADFPLQLASNLGLS